MSAQMEEKIFVAKLVHHFDFSTKATQDIHNMCELIMRPSSGIPVTAKLRRPVPA